MEITTSMHQLPDPRWERRVAWGQFGFCDGLAMALRESRAVIRRFRIDRTYNHLVSCYWINCWVERQLEEPNGAAQMQEGLEKSISTFTTLADRMRKAAVLHCPEQVEAFHKEGRLFRKGAIRRGNLEGWAHEKVGIEAVAWLLLSAQLHVIEGSPKDLETVLVASGQDYRGHLTDLWESVEPIQADSIRQIFQKFELLEGTWTRCVAAMIRHGRFEPGRLDRAVLQITGLTRLDYLRLINPFYHAVLFRIRDQPVLDLRLPHKD